MDLPAMSLRWFEDPFLAIESSCDETSAAVLKGSEVLSNIVSSQIPLHQNTGGVVPEVAARAHVEAIVPVIEEALLTAHLDYREIRAVAVTNRPGLLGSLSVGVTAAKSIALTQDIPLLAVHHLEGHVLSPLATQPNLEFPHICLLVSGGHTEIIQVKQVGDYEILGQTRDDAAGEAFDKSARLLGFEYPGGKALSECAQSGNLSRYKLPRGLEREDTLDFSFSGLKTAVLRLVQSEGDNLDRNDAAASIEEAITCVLEERTMRAVIERGCGTVTLAGGVAANSRLRQRLQAACDREGVEFVPAPLEICTDNAAMIGIAASLRLAAGQSDSLQVDCLANAPLPGWTQP